MDTNEDMTTRDRAEAALRALVGHPDARLREDQWRAIEELVVHRRRALVVQRTGWGKSAVYFVATALLRGGVEGRPPAGPTIIISPLLALMRDQIAAAAREIGRASCRERVEVAVAAVADNETRRPHTEGVMR